MSETRHAIQGLNRAFLIGTIGNEPEIRTAASGAPVLKLSLATPNTRPVRNTEGGETMVDVPDWHRLTLFGDHATFLGQSAKKGDILGVECSLKPGRWLDTEGTVHYSLDLIVERILVLQSVAKTVDLGKG